LESILKKYKKNGLTSWWEVVAIYNADENPADYKNFKDLYLSLEGTANLKMASYVIVANIAVICGTDRGEFAKYEEYKSDLKNLLENPSNDYTLNDYIFGFYALRCSGTDFDMNYFHEHLRGAQKSDGGFSLSSKSDSGDVDVTAFVISALRLIYRNDDPAIRVSYDKSIMLPAAEFLENNINENGTFSSYGSENANSTSCAISALTGWYGDTEIMQKAINGLELFKAKEKKDIGYSFLIGGRIDTLATAQAAIALGDLKNKTSVWEKLYLDSVGYIE
jgi:hypothetical protein